MGKSNLMKHNGCFCYNKFMNYPLPCRNISSETLTSDTKAILEEIVRCLNLEKKLPCYKQVVSAACLRTIRKLQKFGHLPSQPQIFRSYTQYGVFIGECLIS